MKQNKTGKPELLVPASSLEVLRTAVIFGADAVYIGGEAFGLRAKAKNFSMEEMAEGIRFAHERDVKVYVTANILAHNEDLAGAESYFEELKALKPDALIISDPGMFLVAKEVCPEIEIIYPRRQTTRIIDVSVLVAAGGETCRVCERAFTGGNPADSGQDTGTDGDRELYPRGNVYFLFRKMPAVKLFYRKRCKPRGLYTSLPVEICGG